MSVARPMVNLAKRHNKEAADRREKLRVKRIVDAINRHTRLVERAISFGAGKDDPLYIKCVMAHYQTRPTVFNNKLVIDIEVDRHHQRFIGKRSRIVGEIHFFPLGGIAGVKVVDSKGELMVCEGSCIQDAKWSMFTWDFHLIPHNQNEIDELVAKAKS